MQIVIDIPEAVLNRICSPPTYPLDMVIVCNAILEHVKLPKGHGRLIDEKEILNNPDGIYYDLYDVPGYLEACIPTVIEADKEGE